MKLLPFFFLLSAACGRPSPPSPPPPPPPPALNFLTEGEMNCAFASTMPAAWQQAIAEIAAAKPGVAVATDIGWHVWICLPVDITLTGGQKAFRVTRLPEHLRNSIGQATYCDAQDCYLRGATCIGFNCGPTGKNFSWVVSDPDPVAFQAVLRHEARFGIYALNWPAEACRNGVGLVWQHIGEGDACDPLRGGQR